MEILAHKKQGLPWPNIILIIIGAFSLILAATMFSLSVYFIGVQALLILIPLCPLATVGIAIIVINTLFLLRVNNTPDRITLSGDRVDLGKGLIVNLNQILRVDYREARARYYFYGWGTLTVYLENQKIDYYFYDDVQYARDRMMQLIWQAASRK